MDTSFAMVNAREIRAALMADIVEVMLGQGLTADELVSILRDGLRSTTSRTIRLRGLAPDDLPEGYRRICVSEMSRPHRRRPSPGDTDRAPDIRAADDDDDDDDQSSSSSSVPAETLIEQVAPDWATRRAYLDTALRLCGAYPAEQHDHSGGVEVVIRDCVAEARAAMAEATASQRSSKPAKVPRKRTGGPR